MSTITENTRVAAYHFAGRPDVRYTREVNLRHARAQGLDDITGAQRVLSIFLGREVTIVSVMDLEEAARLNRLRLRLQAGAIAPSQAAAVHAELAQAGVL